MRKELTTVGFCERDIRTMKAFGIEAQMKKAVSLVGNSDRERMPKLMDKLRPCPFCGKPVFLCYTSSEAAFGVRHTTLEDSWNCYIAEPIMLKTASLADATVDWNRRFDNE